jgi:hypothetical protein
MIVVFAQTPPMQKGDIRCAVEKALQEISFQLSSPYPVRKLAFLSWQLQVQNIKAYGEEQEKLEVLNLMYSMFPV